MVQFKVIAGLVKLYGHTFQPSTIFCDAYPLSAQLKMKAVSMDEVTAVKQKEYAMGINATPLAFRQAKRVISLGKAMVDLSGEEPSIYVEIELNQTDCREINNYMQHHSMSNMCAIVVFRELRSSTIEILLKSFPFYCHNDQVGVVNSMQLLLNV